MQKMANMQAITPPIKWCQIEVFGMPPKPRHGHRAVTIRDMMIVYGGGNEGIVDSLNVYRSTTNQWYVPVVKGEIPPGCAAFGFCTDGINRVFICGGMQEYGRYSNDIYELKISTWEWKKITTRKPKNADMPRARLGHSFTMIGTKLFLFGGLANSVDNPKQNCPVYLNDLYTIEIKTNSTIHQWECPVTYGSPPTPRESHSAVSYVTSHGQSKLIIFGGMNGSRLGDFFVLDIQTMTWSQPITFGPSPLPRSLHSAVVINHRMYVFGGWVPTSNESTTQREITNQWKCSNTMSVFNLDSLTWEQSTKESLHHFWPGARAGHASAAIGSRLYIWSGRDGFRKMYSNQICFTDLWYLETELPAAPTKLQLTKANTIALDVSWSPVLNAECYIVQIMRILDVPPPPIPTPSDLLAMASGSAPVPKIPSARSISAASKQDMKKNNLPVIVASQPASIPLPIVGPPLVTPTSVVLPLQAHSTSTIAVSMATYGSAPPMFSQPVPVQNMVGMAALAAAAEQATGRITSSPKVIQVPISTQMLNHSAAVVSSTPKLVVTSVPQPMVAFTSAPGIQPPIIVSTGPIPGNQMVRLVSSSHNSSIPSSTPMIFKTSISGPSVVTRPALSAQNKPTGPIIKVIRPGDIVTNSIQASEQTTGQTGIATTSPIINRAPNPSNFGKIISGGPGGVKMLVIPSSSATVAPGQQGMPRTRPMTKMFLPKTVNLRHFSSPIRVLSANGATGTAPPRYIFQMSNSAGPGTVSMRMDGSTIGANNFSSNHSVGVVGVGPGGDKPMTVNIKNSVIVTESAQPANTAPPPPNTIPQVDGFDSDDDAGENQTLELANQNLSGDNSQTSDSTPAPSVPASEQPEAPRDMNAPLMIPTQNNPNGRTTQAGGTTTPSIVINFQRPQPAITTAPSTAAGVVITSVPSVVTSAETSRPFIAPTSKVKLVQNVPNQLNNQNANTVASNSSQFRPTILKRSSIDIIGKWFNVGIARMPKYNIGGFHVPSQNKDYDPEKRFDSQSLPVFDEQTLIDLEPGTSYKIRVAGVNQLGRGPWSEDLYLRTYIPGFPAAPSQIRITKQPDGAQLTWGCNKSEEVLEYTVFLAVEAPTPEGMVFGKIYAGAKAHCFVSSKELQEACLDNSHEKPAVVFRVVAKNSLGFGPATQVKWIMEPSMAMAPSSFSSGAAVTAAGSTAAGAAPGFSSTPAPTAAAGRKRQAPGQ